MGWPGISPIHLLKIIGNGQDRIYVYDTVIVVVNGPSLLSSISHASPPAVGQKITAHAEKGVFQNKKIYNAIAVPVRAVSQGLAGHELGDADSSVE